MQWHNENKQVKKVEMNKDRKHIGEDLFNMAKQWLLPPSGGQVTSSKEEKKHVIEKKRHASRSNESIFSESSPHLELQVQRSLPSNTKDNLAPFAKNINPSRSVGCLQTLKTVQSSKGVDVPTIIVNRNVAKAEKKKDECRCCPTCGQQWPREAPIIETATPMEQKVSKLDSQTPKGVDSNTTLSLPSQNKHQIFDLKRSSSFGHKGKSRNNVQDTSRISRVIKAASMMDDQIHTAHKQSNPKFGRTVSKESSKSSVSLTRSLSLNLDTLRIVKTDTSQDESCLNLLKSKKRSIKSGTSHDKSIDCDEPAKCPGAEYDDIVNYSPKITKDTKYVNGCPLDEFKTIFDAESFRIPSIYGQLKIMFQFFNDTNELQVTVLEASNVRVGNQSDNIGIFTKICLMPGKVQGKTGFDKHSTCNPVFYESFIFKMSLTQLLERQLKIKLYNKPGVFSISEPIGQCIVPLYNYDLTAVNVIWQNLQKCKGQKDEMDEFDFSFFERDKVPERKFGRFLCGYHGQDN